MPYTVYILQCRGGSLYTGIAKDLPSRLRTHRSGRGSKYVASRLPVRVVRQERATSKSRALRREAAIKAMTRAGKLALIANRKPRTGN